MGRAFEYRKATKLKRWGNMARTFTRIGKQIAIAVKAGGPDPENNPHLRAVVANAKRENMPKDNVERAIKNAMGKDQKDYKEMNYEGYGPYGVAIFVETATDNTTRTVANVRSVFNKFGGSLGTSGSLDFIFSWKSMFTFKKKDGLDMDELILELIDYGVEDEYDEEERTYVKLNDRTYIFEAKTQLTDFYKITKLSADIFEPEANEADTLAGLLLEIKGEFPVLHEKLEYKDSTFEVLEMDDRRILKVKFTINDDHKEEA